MLVLLGGVLALYHSLGGVLIGASHFFHIFDQIGFGKG